MRLFILWFVVFVARGMTADGMGGYSAEKAVNERLAQTPEVYVLALTQFATRADTEVVSIFLFTVDSIY